MIDPVVKMMLDVSLALSSEKDDDALLERILSVAMDVTACDAGTLYIKEKEELNFNVMITKSMGGRIDDIKLPPVKIQPSNVCARAVIDKRVINIEDVCKTDEFDFSGPKKYDAMTGYNTKSMLVVPMGDNNGRQIGVLQLINATQDGKVVPFKYEHEIYVSALTSQAAISLVKMKQAKEIKGLLDSLVGALSTAIYERTPYNVTHTKNMYKYAERFLKWLDDMNSPYKMDEGKKQQFLMSVKLHDVGKLTVPLEVMNKESRLSTGMDRVKTRFEIIDFAARVGQVENNLPYEEVKELLDNAMCTIEMVNNIAYLPEDLEEEIKIIAARTYIDARGVEQNWLTEGETEALCIKKGTLTAAERKIMESHVEMTKRILEEVSFGSEYDMVARWAGNHHEFINGSGYPEKLSGDEVCRETRLLTIIDVFDGLSAVDRPYKKPIPIKTVFEIMYAMVYEGKIDEEILGLFKSSRVWEDNNGEDIKE